jgi:DNA (cytosine-5)-methyltransferase 1
MTDYLTHLDLFSGIGGFALAAQWAGFKTVQFVEKDKFCQKVLIKHWPNVPIHEDIKSFSYSSNIDLLTGGFPCQPFSVAGKKHGAQDDRYLWPEMFRIIRECKPRYIVAENVPGIIPMLDPILEDLEREGYTWWAYLIPASLIGAPHKRERLWIVAHCNSKRLDNGCDNWEERLLQDDWQRNIEAIQSEWPQLIPKSWKTFNTEEWLGFTADTNSQQCHQREEDLQSTSERLEWQNTSPEIRGASCNSNSITGEQADTGTLTESQKRHTRFRYSGQLRESERLFNWQEDKPPIPGVDDGLPDGVDRNKSLGNAIVPQVVYPILRMLRMLDD